MFEFSRMKTNYTPKCRFEFLKAVFPFQCLVAKDVGASAFRWVVCLVESLLAFLVESPLVFLAESRE